MTWTTIPTWLGLVMAGAGFVSGAAAGVLVGAALAASSRPAGSLVIDFRHLRLSGWSFSSDEPRIAGAGYDTLAVAKLAAAQALVDRFDVDDDPALRSS